ncbi:unnamed protein product [Ophioblennius macclurei]
MVTVARAALYLCVWLFASGVGGSYVPSKMNRTIQNLMQHYKISNKEKFDGNPVFSKDLLSGNAEMRMVFLGGALDTYKELLEHMLEQLPTPSPAVAASASASGVTAGSKAATSDAGDQDVRGGLRFLLEKIEDLKMVRFKQQEELVKGLQSLQKIEFDDRVVQGKALFQLVPLYEEASLLSDSERRERRRRRRQTKFRRI